MAASSTFVGFFSYAHHDRELDPKAFEMLTRELEKRVTARLINDRFEVWRDSNNLRTGDRWSAELERAVKQSDVLIVLLSPRWMTSAVCRQEYEYFRSVEASRPELSLIIPLLHRSPKDAISRFDEGQSALWNEINERQYFRIDAEQLLTASKANRSRIAEKIAEDLVGILMRLAKIRAHSTDNRAATFISTNRAKQGRELSPRALNFRDVDPVSSAQVKLKGSKVYAQVSFVERLFVEGRLGRVEFGVRRAYLTIHQPNAKRLKPDPRLFEGSSRVRLVTLHSAPDDLHICLEADPTTGVISELALPPGPDDNFWCHVAVSSEPLRASDLSSELMLLLDADGLWLVSEKQTATPHDVKQKIKSIMAIAQKRRFSNRLDSEGRLRYSVQIEEDDET